MTLWYTLQYLNFIILNFICFNNLFNFKFDNIIRWCNLLIYEKSLRIEPCGTLCNIWILFILIICLRLHLIIYKNALELWKKIRIYIIFFFRCWRLSLCLHYLFFACVNKENICIILIIYDPVRCIFNIVHGSLWYFINEVMYYVRYMYNNFNYVTKVCLSKSIERTLCSSFEFWYFWFRKCGMKL